MDFLHTVNYSGKLTVVCFFVFCCFFYKMGFTPRKAEQLQQGMKLKIKAYRKSV